MATASYTHTHHADKPATFLVGSIGDSLKDWLGGCPFARTMTATAAEFANPIMISLPCKRWGCCHCGRVRVAQLARNTAAAKPNKLITLTINPAAFENPRDAYDKTRRKLCDFNKAIRKKVGEFEYVRVLEVTKAGWPHYHIVARSKYIPKQFISDTWASLTGATIVDVRQLRDTDNVLAYVMKYLSKQTYIPWTNRRVCWSKNFFPKKDDSDKVHWTLDAKMFYQEHPIEVIEQRYWHRELRQIGAYAWELVPWPTGTVKPKRAN